MSLLRTLRFIVTHPLNQKQKSEAVLRYLRWQLGSRIWGGDMVHQWIAGTKLKLSTGEFGLTGNIYAGLHEYSHMSYVLHAMTPSSLFVDIGANVGSYTILASGVIGARSYCFEPIPETYERLMSNLRLNDLTDRVKALNLGLGEEEGELHFITNENTMNRVARPGEEHTGATASVNIKRLDDILKDESPSLMKIDVEGFETAVVRGAQETLQKPSLHSLIMEFGAGEAYGYDEQELIRYLQSLGFRSYHYDPMQRQLIDLHGKLDDIDDTNGNTLFVRDIDAVKQLLRDNPPITLNGLRF